MPGVLAPDPALGSGGSEGEERGVSADLRGQLWWSRADECELDALILELAHAVHDHREAGCVLCAAGYPPCPRVQAAIAVVVDWRETRIRVSRAVWERSRQDWLDEVAEAGR
jgi:hypothetical protein